MKSEFSALLDDIANTHDYENLVEILGDELGGKLYRLVDMARDADRELDLLHDCITELYNYDVALPHIKKCLSKIRHELGGDEVFIREIEENESISDETKLHALCEIDLMRRGEAANAYYDRRVQTLSGAFIWDNAPSGREFWSMIDQTV